jgi:hypothetical protein
MGLAWLGWAGLLAVHNHVFTLHLTEFMDWRLFPSSLLLGEALGGKGGGGREGWMDGIEDGRVGWRNGEWGFLSSQPRHG